MLVLGTQIDELDFLTMFFIYGRWSSSSGQNFKLIVSGSRFYIAGHLCLLYWVLKNKKFQITGTNDVELKILYCLRIFHYNILNEMHFCSRLICKNPPGFGDYMIL